MLKRAYGFIAVMAVFVLYFWFSYARIYNVIGEKNLQSPYETTRLVLENPAGIGAVKYVVLGDSLGAGVGADKMEESYPYLYAQNLLKKYQKVELVNLAYPGDTAYELIKNQLDVAVKESPDYVSLLIGINDLHNHVLAKRFQSNYRQILEMLLTNTKAKIVVVNLPYLASDKLVHPPFNWLLDARTREFNKIIYDLATTDAIRMIYIDLYTDARQLSKTTPGYYAEDYFHPSGKGYKLWSKSINVAE